MLEVPQLLRNNHQEDKNIQISMVNTMAVDGLSTQGAQVFKRCYL